MDDAKGKNMVSGMIKKYGEHNRELINQCIYKQVRKGRRIGQVNVSIEWEEFFMVVETYWSFFLLQVDEVDRAVAYRLINPHHSSVASITGSRSPKREQIGIGDDGRMVY